MARPRRRHAAAPVVLRRINPPSDDQLARLQALLRQLEDNGSLLNYPIDSLLFSGVMSGVRTVVSSELILRSFEYFFYEWLALSADSWIPSIALTMAVPAVFYVYKKIFDLIAALVNKVFPNGFLFSREKHRAYGFHEQLGSQEQVASLITELEAFVASQNRAARWTWMGTLVASFLVTFFNSINVTSARVGMERQHQVRMGGGAFTLSAAILGPRIVYSHPQMTALGKALNVASGDLQGLYFYRGLKVLWQSLHKGRVLRDYLKRMCFIACGESFAEVRVPNVDQALFKLDLSREVLRIEIEGQVYTLSSASYLNALHKILLREGFPVYNRGDGSLFVGYMPLSERRAKRLGAELGQRIRVLSREEALHGALNRLTAAAAPLTQVGELGWEYVISHASAASGAVYFLELPKKMSDVQLGRLIAGINRVVSPASVNQVGQQLLLQFDSVGAFCFDEAPLEDVLRTFAVTQRSVAAPDVLHRKPPAPSAVEQRRVDDALVELRSMQAAGALLGEPSESSDAGEGLVESADAAAASAGRVMSAQPQPTETRPSLRFPSGARTLYQHGDSFSWDVANDVVFELSVPWLKEGRAYACVSPGLEEWAGVHGMRTEDIVRHLERGRVFGQSRVQSRTKAGGVGLEVDTCPYQDVEGREHTGFCKVKVTNNFRVFGHVRERGAEGELLICFDGPGYGH